MLENLYVVRAANTKGEVLVKMGYSANIEKRLTQYAYHNPLIEVIGTYYKPDAAEFEKNLHKALKSTAFEEWYSEDKLPIILEAIATGILPTESSACKRTTTDFYTDSLEYIITNASSHTYNGFMKLALRATKSRLYLPAITDSTSLANLSDVMGINKNNAQFVKAELKDLDIIRTIGDMWVMNPHIVRCECGNDVIELFKNSFYRSL